MTPASAKQGGNEGSSEGNDLEPQFIQVNASQLDESQLSQMITISRENIGGIQVPAQDIEGLNADEFNLRANLLYNEYAE